MMTAEQTKIDKAKQDQQTVQWKQDAYQDIIKDIKDLQNTYFNSLDSSTNILSSSNYAGYDSTVEDTTAVSVTPGVNVETGNYSISFGEDGQLASSAKKLGSQLAYGTVNTTTMSNLGMTSDTTFTLSYNGTDTDITIKTTDTINNVINKINSNTSGGVTAKYSELTRKFTLETSDTGSNKTISIDKDITVLGLTQTNATGEGVGKDAVVYITPPGAEEGTKVTKSSNNFTIDSLTYNLLSKTDTSFNVTQDTQKVYDKISEFLDKYNAIVDKIQTKLTEKKDYDYKPLTDSQKEDMSSSQITTWEEKAKTGILRNDENLQNILTSMRSAFTSAVSNTGLSFGKYGSNSIGLDTSSDITEGGKITIVDEQKFKAAIAQHDDQILKLFTNVSTDTDKTTKFNDSGIFQRLSSIFVDNVGYTGTTLNSAILTKYANYQGDYSTYGSSGTNTLPDQLYRQTQLLKNLNTEFSDKQEKYYQQFSALETALTQMNSQQSMLSSLSS
ncbi:MAG: fliD, partial [Clostridia bacterium]|nr:fliD [Clostridia bacterium]